MYNTLLLNKRLLIVALFLFVQTYEQCLAPSEPDHHLLGQLRICFSTQQFRRASGFSGCAFRKCAPSVESILNSNLELLLVSAQSRLVLLWVEALGLCAGACFQLEPIRRALQLACAAYGVLGENCKSIPQISVRQQHGFSFLSPVIQAEEQLSILRILQLRVAPRTHQLAIMADDNC